MNLELLRSLGTAAAFSKNDIVFMQNDISADLYIVLKGTFGVYINSFSDFPVRVAGIAAGSFFGEMAFIDNSPRSATVIAEDDAAALRIGKDGFAQLLEKSPDMAVAILTSLRQRVSATADRVRSMGGEAPELPELLKIMRFSDADSGMALLASLSSWLRRMNDILAAGAPEPQPQLTHTAREGAITLLPEEYIPFDLDDENNNRDMLRGIKVICPYCGVESDAYIPLFSMLRESHSTLDGRVVYSNLDILRYTNIICPNCNFADTYVEFTKLKFPLRVPRYTGNQFRNAERFTGYGKKLNHTLDEAVLSYYMNIDSLSRVSGEPRRIAKAWMRLYWIYGDHNRPQLMLNAAERARYYYGAYFDRHMHRMTGENRMRACAILGELSASLGEYGEALGHYEKSMALGRAMNNDLLRKHRKRYAEIKRL